MWCRRYCENKDGMNLRDRISANAINAVFYGNYYTRIKYFRQLLEVDDQEPDDLVQHRRLLF